MLGTLFLAVLFALTVSPSAAAEPMDKNCVSDPETATVGEVIDGETLNLSDGRIVRLIGAKAPPLPLSWRGDDPWPLVAESKRALDRLASGKQVELKFGGRRSDRYDHVLAQAFVLGNDKPIWLQEESPRVLPASIPPPTTAPASQSFSRAREGEGEASRRMGLFGLPHRER